MNMHYNRFLFALLCVILCCSAAQATNLQISVQDSIDNTSISHATVYQNGVIVGKTDNFGQYLLVHPGLVDQDIRITMLGYNDWEQSVDRNATSVLVNLTRQTLTLNVKLYDSDTLNPIPGATVNITAINATQSKSTDPLGSATFAVEAVTVYTLDVMAPNYVPRSSTVDVETVDKTVQYWLLSENRFSFMITDNDTGQAVPGANILLNNVLIGTTDSRGVLSSTITRGAIYTIAVEKQGYQTTTDTRMIQDTDALYTATLSKSPVGAYIDVYDQNRLPLSGVDIYLNGTKSGSTDIYGRANFPNLLSGVYQVDAKKSGYVTASRVITVSAQGEEYSLEMPYQSATLTIFAQDADQKEVPNATVLLNDNNAGATDNGGQFVTAISFDTPYNITLSKDGYQPASVQTEIIHGNGTSSVTITLQKNLDWGLITMVAAGAIGVLVLFAAIRMFGRRKAGHVTRRNEL